ncbi:MAG: DNA mismatch repair endonuclease MutL [Vicingaceae bacterium]
MKDVIKLLPDTVANQIAAGEVVQRPASVVKELLENSIDAQASKITLIVKDAGKSLIQVIDNGVGMSETDARLCFERHATSKIKDSKDLFSITTMGFRGEAMASIAAIAHVTLKTKVDASELGTQIEIEGNNLIKQIPCSVPTGTNICVKNIFYNVPARRKFLKSNNVEFKHIFEEFERVALINPQIEFEFFNNNEEVIKLPKGNFRQRIVNLFGKKYNEKLVPVKESTDIVQVEGFICKPEYSRKTRGEQFFFLNNRFIKSAYLNHAVVKAFEELIPKENYPGYFIHLKIDPSNVDINIHPTKTEVKFVDEKAIYAIISTSVKQALGKYNITPSLDFDQEMSFDIPLINSNKEVKPPTIKVNPDYNPFKNKADSKDKSFDTVLQKEKNNLKNWELLLNGFENNEETPQSNDLPLEGQTLNIESQADKEEIENSIIQVFNKFLVLEHHQKLLIIDQQKAHTRVLFEQMLNALENRAMSSQQLLFPETIEFTPKNVSIIEGILDDLRLLGFDINKFGNNTFVISGVPQSIENAPLEVVLEQILEQIKNDENIDLEVTKKIAFSIAKSGAVKPGKALTKEEMEYIVNQLFECKQPNYLPNGKKIILSYTDKALLNQFE